MPAGLAAQNNPDSPRNQVRYSLKILDTLGRTFGEAYGIKNRGSVGGVCSLPGDATADATLWRNGVMTDLGKELFQWRTTSPSPGRV
jgi:hypothetical protein